MSRLISLNVEFAHLPIREITSLARELVILECNIESAVWIAIKFVGRQDISPSADVMAAAGGVSVPALLTYERQDLKRIDWDIVPLMRKLDLMG